MCAVIGTHTHLRQQQRPRRRRPAARAQMRWAAWNRSWGSAGAARARAARWARRGRCSCIPDSAASPSTLTSPLTPARTRKSNVLYSVQNRIMYRILTENQKIKLVIRAQIRWDARTNWLIWANVGFSMWRSWEAILCSAVLSITT